MDRSEANSFHQEPLRAWKQSVDNTFFPCDQPTVKIVLNVMHLLIPSTFFASLLIASHHFYLHFLDDSLEKTTHQRKTHFTRQTTTDGNTIPEGHSELFMVRICSLHEEISLDWISNIKDMSTAQVDLHFVIDRVDLCSSTREPRSIQDSVFVSRRSNDDHFLSARLCHRFTRDGKIKKLSADVNLRIIDVV